MLLQALYKRFRFLTKLSIFLTVVLTSCGPGGNSLISKKTNKPVTVSQALSRCASESNESFRGIKELVTSHSFGVNLISQSKSLRSQKKKISFLSRAELEARAQALLHGPLASQSTSTVEQALTLKRELADLKKLNEQIQRLEFLECNLDSYWQQSKIPYLDYIDSLELGPSQERTTKLCEVFKGEAFCQIEVRTALRQRQLEQVHSNYLARFEEEFFEPRFQITSKLSGVTCKKGSDGESVLTLPVNAQGLDLSLMAIAAMSWSSLEHKVRLKVVQSNSINAVRINRIESGPSHVDMNSRSEINLGPGHNSPLIIAHELGHILGFPDCYFEGWDQQRQGFIYFELDPQGNNLMCNLKQGSKIQKSYFEQLKQHYCN